MLTKIIFQNVKQPPGANLLTRFQIISQNSEEKQMFWHICFSSEFCESIICLFFIKVAGSRPTTSSKQRFQGMYFTVYFTKF